MVRRSETLPLFDERFINYGFNKVQWIEYLRYLGYEYYILSRSFAFDIPHAPYVMFMCLMQIKVCKRVYSSI